MQDGLALVTGQAVGEGIGTGPVGVVRDVTELLQLQTGEVLVAVDTISLNADTAIKTAFVIARAEGRREAAASPRIEPRVAIAD